ncbi:MAG: 50S ribosomal protein L10 [Acidobacteriota bacterium]|nr:50S ribosomal protein L10 [Acidobacteriota bacterium]
MNREEKAAVIDQIADELRGSDAIVALDYRGITVAQIAELRGKLRDADTRLRVTKNSLSERAADQAGVAEIKPMLVGPTALALVRGDAAAAAKVLSDTARALRGPLQFKGGFMSGSLLSAADLEAIAKLPTREVLNAQLVGTVAAPLTGLARTLNALIAGIAIQLGQIRDQGLVSGAAASTPADAPSADDEPAAEAPAAETEAGDAAATETEAGDAAATETEADAAPAAQAETEDEAAPAAETGAVADDAAAPDN